MLNFRNLGHVLKSNNSNISPTVVSRPTLLYLSYKHVSLVVKGVLDNFGLDIAEVKIRHLLYVPSSQVIMPIFSKIYIYSWRSLWLVASFLRRVTGFVTPFAFMRILLGLSCKANGIPNKSNECLVVNEEKMTWYEARNRCIDFGGDLATFEDVSKIEKLSSMMTSDKAYHVGMENSRWTWYQSGICHRLAIRLKPFIFQLICHRKYKYENRFRHRHSIISLSVSLPVFNICVCNLFFSSVHAFIRVSPSVSMYVSLPVYLHLCMILYRCRQA